MIIPLSRLYLVQIFARAVRACIICFKQSACCNNGVVMLHMHVHNGWPSYPYDMHQCPDRSGSKCALLGLASCTCTIQLAATLYGRHCFHCLIWNLLNAILIKGTWMGPFFFERAHGMRRMPIMLMAMPIGSADWLSHSTSFHRPSSGIRIWRVWVDLHLYLLWLLWWSWSTFTSAYR